MAGAGNALTLGEIARDREIAARHGFSQPYVSGPQAGTCPGTAEYGHGMSLTSVHGGCCARWERVRNEKALKEPELEAGG
jgi:hypothetical protein